MSVISQFVDMKWAINILFLLLSSCCLPQEMEQFGMDDFEEVDFPSNDYLRELNHANTDWVVFKKDNEVLFCDRTEVGFRGDSLTFSLDSIEFKREDHVMLIGVCHLKVENGWLIGTNAGEWGGNLIWVSENLRSYKLLVRANVNQLFLWENEIYVLEGLSHLNSRGGSLFRINDQLAVDTVKTFNETPYSSQIASDSLLYIITDSSLLSLDRNNNQKTLFTNEEWTYLDPTSMVLDENKLYIAMRGGIGLFYLESATMKWMRM